MKKIRSKILAIAMSLTMLFTASYSAPSYADSRKFVIRDIIQLAKYIAGKYDYTDNDKKNSADLNGDGVLNGEDLLLMIKVIAGEIDISTTPDKLSYSEKLNGFNYIGNWKDGYREKIGNTAVITSYEEYTEYYENLIKCFDCIFNDLDNGFIYTEEYFENNVLLVKVIDQGWITTPEAVKEIKQTDNKELLITLNHIGTIESAIPFSLFIQVTIPKNYYHGKVIWESVSPHTSAKVNTISSSEFLVRDLLIGNDLSAVITSVNDLNNYIEWVTKVEWVTGVPGYDRLVVLPEFLKVYNDEYFEENVLLINAYYQPCCDIHYQIGDVKYADNTLTITVNNNDDPYIGHPEALATAYAQVTVPREFYSGGQVVWKTVDTATEFQSENLMFGVSSQAVTGKEADDEFIGSIANFSVDLFKQSLTENKNSLVSPTSVMLALSMTANGADSETLSQMEKVLGGNIPLPTLNEYLYSYVNGLPSSEKSKLSIANSIWFRDDESRFSVKPDFLQKNADYYNAAAYKSPFNNKTLEDINNWVDKNTDGMIDKILDEIPEEAVMYLINAMAFDAEWSKIYSEWNIRNGDFTNINGAKQNVEFMYSEESSYLNDGKATGFIKPYAGNHYSFAALMPNEGITVDEYLQSMTGESFLNTVKNAKSTNVFAYLPKFEYDYSILMNDALQTLGITDAFDRYKSDFSQMVTSPYNIYISRVLHKTFISVDERGTKAGAVTVVEITDECEPMGEYVRLDRPFVYAIIDNATNLPIFIGTVMTID